MRLLYRCLTIAMLVCGALESVSANAAARGDCRQTSLDQLRAHSRDGYAIYEKIGKPDVFESWIDCAASQYDLSTAVHESTHVITAEIDAFPLVGGGTIKRPHEASDFFPPFHIANRFKADNFTTIYLKRGKASSSTDFLYLLDELNAYSHDLNAAVDLRNLSATDEVVDHRDGLAAMMAFLAVYVETARDSEPRTWSGLQSAPMRRTISALWGRAERVMASSCGIPHFGILDISYIKQFCAAEARLALEPILGRAPVCPTACLSPTFDAEQTSGIDPIVTSSFRISKRARGSLVEGKGQSGSARATPR